MINKSNANNNNSYKIEYDPHLKAMILKIIDTEGMFPLYVHENHGDMYKINKNRTGKLQMTK